MFKIYPIYNNFFKLQSLLILSVFRERERGGKRTGREKRGENIKRAGKEKRYNERNQRM